MEEKIVLEMTIDEAQQLKTAVQFYMSHYECGEKSAIPGIFEELRKAICK